MTIGLGASAQHRRRLRLLAGATLVSLGTAVFSGAVSIVVDALVKATSLNWPLLTAFTALGVVLSSGGAWLLGTIRTGVGLALAATDARGGTDRYQDEAEAFAAFGNGQFVLQTQLQIPVETTDDLPLLRTRLTGAIRTLTQTEPGARTIGMLFQGRPEVGFHVGGWLNVASRRVDLYTDVRDGDTPATHIKAARLTPRSATAPRILDLLLITSGEERRVALRDLPDYSRHRACIALGINTNGPVDQAGFRGPVVDSARREGAEVIVLAALPSESGHWLKATTAEYESTVAAIAEVAGLLGADPGLLYMKTPAVIPVALGRMLYRANWIPMQYVTVSDVGTYLRFTE
ncbi:hypothetical protein J5X84_42935 [Streptosporangiaceae bacterium NEAU-GS5]|nr:hypothetical protein [Streptosporangiaceae bacterium NEAU-GS5]